jgi:hypothetical protein
MTFRRLTLVCVATLVLFDYMGLAAPQQLLTGPPHDSGQSITAAFEGWFKNPDGSFSLLFGYYNRNLKQELDIQPGPNNRMEPGGPDLGQPSHFLPGRQWGVFTVIEPASFQGAKLTWSLTANGVTTTVPGSLNPLWELSPFRDATGNTPPFLGFSKGGPFVQGPRGESTSLAAVSSSPVTLELWVADDASVAPGAPHPSSSPVTLTWSKFRGPGSVIFENATPSAESADFEAPAGTVFRGKAATTATFSEPGEYVLRVVANDWSGEGGRGFQCCWSNAQVKVSVKP